MWTEVLISIDEAHAEDLSDALMEAGALSVSVEDENADTDAEVPLYGERAWSPPRTRGSNHVWWFWWKPKQTLNTCWMLRFDAGFTCARI